MKDSQKSVELRRGVIVFVVLAVLTGGEYAIAVTTQLWAALIVIALIKAALVVQYFMHLPRVMSPEEGGPG